MDSLTVYSKIIGYSDNLKALRALFSYPLNEWVSRYFLWTRNMEAQLGFVDYCRQIVDYYRNDLSNEEYEQFDQELILYELTAYDYLNRWQEYIDLFEMTRAGKDYTSTYMLYRNDPVFNSYVLHRDEHYQYVHFLYLSDSRYRTICRKLQREIAGKSVEHLKRHQRERLSNEERDSRQAEMARLFEYLKGQRAG